MTTAQKQAANAVKSALFTRNILAVYYSATTADLQSGADWYARAQQIAADMSANYGLTLNQCAGILAAVSPLKEWSQNVRLAESLIAKHVATGQTAIKHGGTFKALLRKVDLVFATTNPTADDIAAIMNGDKIAAFSRNILGDMNGVCVDGHATNIAHYGMIRVGIPEAKSPGKAQYKILVSAYSAAAATVGISPAAMQAITWLAYKSIPIVKKSAK